MPKVVLPKLKFHPLVGLIALSIFVLSFYNITRHVSVNSTGLDLGLFDQAAYLISQGLPPLSSFLGFHILGDHAALFIYPIALLYKLYPTVHWLLLMQSVGLSLGALPTFALARQAGLDQKQSLTLAAVYLLCPVWFNANLFDFHFDTLAPVGLLTAVWAARANRTVLYILSVLFVLSLKDAFSLVIAAMGVWLFLFEKKRAYGIFAVAVGAAWFLLTTKWIVPMLSGKASRALDRYKPFGDTPLEIALNIILKPELTLGRLLTVGNLRYLGMLFLPLVWGLAPRHLAPLIAVTPMLAINMLSNPTSRQRNFHTYHSASLIPFFLVAVIDTVAANRHPLGWLARRFGFSRVNWIIVTCVFVAFAILGRYGELPLYLSRLDRAPNLQAALTLIDSNGAVLTDNPIAPHVSHRPVVHLFCGRTIDKKDETFADYQYVLADEKFPSSNRKSCMVETLELVKNNPDFELRYRQNGFILFERKQSGTPAATPTSSALQSSAS